MKPTSHRILLFFALILLAMVAQAVLTADRPQPHMPMAMPALWVEGWTNTSTPPTGESLAGKWVVVDAWFLACPTCILEMPELAKLRQQLGESDDLVFIGLTTDTREQRGEIESYVAEVKGLDWPVGYGAGATIDKLGVGMFPTLTLFDPTGQLVWQGHYVSDLAKQLEQRL